MSHPETLISFPLSRTVSIKFYNTTTTIYTHTHTSSFSIATTFTARRGTQGVPPTVQPGRHRGWYHRRLDHRIWKYDLRIRPPNEEARVLEIKYPDLPVSKIGFHLLKDQGARWKLHGEAACSSGSSDKNAFFSVVCLVIVGVAS
mmetsp:Transcript_38230/g.92959  ORF Transcript_38230/g.92959 Transcript_38230/m.92959 type:complete len:145 (+) Transcript_38230:488-922(+)